MRDPPFPVKSQLEHSLDVLGQLNNDVAVSKPRLLSQPRIFVADDAKIRCYLV